MLVQQQRMDPTIKETNYTGANQGLLISPNFVFINEPTNMSSKKVYKLIIWFDIISNGLELDFINELNVFTLKDFELNLKILTDDGYKDLSIDKDSIVKKPELSFLHTSQGKRMLSDEDLFIYEIDEKYVTDNISLSFNLNYKNYNAIGLTSDGTNGTNKGTINISLNNTNGENNIEENKVIAFLNNDTYEETKNKVYTLFTTKYNFLPKDVFNINKSNIDIMNVSKEQYNDVPRSLKGTGYLDSIFWDIQNSDIQNEVSIKGISLNTVNIDNYSRKTLDFDFKYEDGYYKTYLTNSSFYNFNTKKIEITSENKNTLFFDTKDAAASINIIFKLGDKQITKQVKINNKDILISDKDLRQTKKYVEYEDLKKNIAFDDFNNLRNESINEI